LNRPESELKKFIILSGSSSIILDKDDSSRVILYDSSLLASFADTELNPKSNMLFPSTLV